MSWTHDDPEIWRRILREAVAKKFEESWREAWSIPDYDSIRSVVHQHITNMVQWLQDEWETVFTAAVLAIPQNYIDQAAEDYLADREADAINAMEIYNRERES